MMMKKMSVLLFPLLVPHVLLHSQEIKNEVRINNDILVNVKRLSKRVLVLNDVPPNGTVTAISTDKGNIIIDTGVSWSFGKSFRKIIEDEFKRADFAYVINTHADRDHTFGNQAFNDAAITGHNNCRRALQKLKIDWHVKKDEYITLHRTRADKNIQELKEMVLDFQQTRERRRLAAANNLIVSDLSEGQEIIPPAITFNDRMTLYCGDITLHMYYLGEGHSDCDILIHVPQESLIVAGDAFIKSMLICYMKQDKFDMARYSETLNAVLSGGRQTKYIVCGHGSPMTYDELLARRGYLDSLLEGINAGYSQKLDLDEVIKRLPLDSYSNLTGLIGKTSSELSEQHAEIIEKYWSLLQGEDLLEQ